MRTAILAMLVWLSSFAAAMLVGLTCYAVSVFAADVISQSGDKLHTVVVTGKRLSVPDFELKEEVETALRSDRYFLDEHVTVTVKDGIATLHGIVYDDWDLRIAIRIASRIRGVKRVIDDLEIKLGGE
jgi:osmotically-inducible protein OsmY